MKIANFVKFYLVTAGLLLLSLTFFPLGALKVALIFLGYTFISPYAFKFYLEYRGVGKGDTVLVTMEKESSNRGLLFEKLPGKALSPGKVGEVIEVDFAGRRASGEVTSAGGLIFPPQVKVLFYQETPLKEV